MKEIVSVELVFIFGIFWAFCCCFSLIILQWCSASVQLSL